MVWLIPLSLGLIVLAANPSVLKELGKLLSGSPATPSTATNGHPPKEASVPVSNEKSGEPDLRRLPDTREIEAIISQDMREQEKRIREGLDRQTPAGKTREVSLYFARYDAPRDQLILAPVKREIKTDDTPAMTALRALMEGPTRAELTSGYRSLIPAGVVIRRMHVEKGILILDVSRDFIDKQRLGQEGLILQIHQVVNTMTDFPSVDGVRFMVDGKILPSAGGDGVPLDKIFRHNRRPLGNR
ncbi:MAG TPA: GerMN domain-containing protein [Spirochaetota bacterium]|nr:GerMN domain-containing protein [Spirochaetota bacterium]HPN82150.1 GerMN domain-containing protein [Spirochaetota bacterium]